MTPPVPILLAAAGALVVLAGALSAVEAAFPRVSRSRVRSLRETGRYGSVSLARLSRDPARTLAVSTLIRVVADTLAVVSITIVVASWREAWWQTLLVAGLGLGLVSFVAIGVGPRALGQRFPEGVSLAGSPLLLVLVALVGPFASVLARGATAAAGGRPSPSGSFATEAELRDLLEQAEESAVIDREENLMAQRVLTLGSLSAREVMVPRTDMVTVNRTVALLDAMELFLKSGFSRLPVVGVDPDDVVGVCYLKDVAAKLHPHSGGAGDPSLVAHLSVADVMRPVLFVPESKAADDLLREMQAASVHLAVVVDEYGGVAGLATIEDLLEEIVGPISDEYDQEAPEAEQLTDTRWRVSARMHLHSLSELVDLDLDDEEVDTVGGLLAKHLGHVPLPGSSAEVDGIVITADSREGRKNRLRTVFVDRLVVLDPDDAEQPVPEGAHA
jgi:CBS domain containing-hemolysin-like protein